MGTIRWWIIGALVAACGNQPGQTAGQTGGQTGSADPGSGSAVTGTGSGGVPTAAAKGAPALPVPAFAFEVPPPRDKIVSISGDAKSTCVVRASGAVDCWGGGDVDAELQRLTAITDAATVAVHGTDRCFVTKTKTVRCEQGDAVVEVPGTAGAVAIATDGTSCAILESGKLACWSAGDDGKPSPAKLVKGPKHVVFATTGELDCAATASGELWCAANGSWRKIAGISGVRMLSFGRSGGSDRDYYADACAVVEGGSLKCFELAWKQGSSRIAFSAWPDEQAARLAAFRDVTALVYEESRLTAISGGKVMTLALEGDGDGAKPSLLPVLADAVAITPSCALRAQGSVVCWGANDDLVLGLPRRASSKQPVAVVGLADVVSISRTWAGMWAVTADGSLHHWGDGRTAVPERVPGVQDLVSVASYSPRDSGVCALRKDASVICAALSTVGPAATWPPAMFDPKLAKVVELAATRVDWLARLADGTVVRWGEGSELPVPLTKLRDVAQIAGEQAWSCARDAAGKVSCAGQRCTRDADTAPWKCVEGDPTPIAMEPVVELAVAVGTACARRASGVVVCWSAGAREGEPASPPVAVPGITDATSLRAQDTGFCVVRRDASLWCWGHRQEPVHLVQPAGTITGPFVGGADGCMLEPDRRVKCWGTNAHGELGDGSVVYLSTPAAVPGL
jgi:hypothetical protein